MTSFKVNHLCTRSIVAVAGKSAPYSLDLCRHFASGSNSRRGAMATGSSAQEGNYLLATI